MVKWLQEITVTPVESDNFYHFHDNRVLPPGIDQERAKAEGAARLLCAAGDWSHRPGRACVFQTLSSCQ